MLDGSAQAGGEQQKANESATNNFFDKLKSPSHTLPSTVCRLPSTVQNGMEWAAC